MTAAGAWRAWPKIPKQSRPVATWPSPTCARLARQAFLAEVNWSLLIADEAQAAKNPGARQTKALKALKTKARLALIGTPVEKRLGDLWSLFDFLNPGPLGTADAFARYAGQRAGSGEEAAHAPSSG